MGCNCGNNNIPTTTSVQQQSTVLPTSACPEVDVMSDCTVLEDQTDRLERVVTDPNSLNSCTWKTSFIRAFSKVICQLRQYNKAFCSLVKTVTCMTEWVSNYSAASAIIDRHLRATLATNPSAYYYPATETEYEIKIYMDSTTGWDATHSVDDGKRTLAPQDYLVFIDWCADFTNSNVDVNDNIEGALNTSLFTVYTSDETISDEMVRLRSKHYQIQGPGSAIEFHEKLKLKTGNLIILNIRNFPNINTGNLRIHQIHVLYMPLSFGGNLPDCINQVGTVTVDPICAQVQECMESFSESDSDDTSGSEAAGS